MPVTAELAPHYDAEVTLYQAVEPLPDVIPSYYAALEQQAEKARLYTHDA